jgi:peptide deformylase
MKQPIKSSILPVYTYDQPVLRQKAIPITDMDDVTLQFIRDMHKTMHGADGIGLAANQVGDTRAIAVVDLSEFEGEDRHPPITLINPVITSYSDEKDSAEEGCLSLPRYRDMVERPVAIQVQYRDESMREHTREIGGFLARVLQHEIDHLNGVYFFDHVNAIRKAMAFQKLKRISLDQVPTSYPLHPNTVRASARVGAKKNR